MRHAGTVRMRIGPPKDREWCPQDRAADRRPEEGRSLVANQTAPRFKNRLRNRSRTAPPPMIPPGSLPGMTILANNPADSFVLQSHNPSAPKPARGAKDLAPVIIGTP